MGLKSTGHYTVKVNLGKPKLSIFVSIFVLSPVQGQNTQCLMEEKKAFSFRQSPLNVPLLVWAFNMRSPADG